MSNKNNNSLSVSNKMRKMSASRLVVLLMMQMLILIQLDTIPLALAQQEPEQEMSCIAPEAFSDCQGMLQQHVSRLESLQMQLVQVQDEQHAQQSDQQVLAEQLRQQVRILQEQLNEAQILLSTQHEQQHDQVLEQQVQTLQHELSEAHAQISALRDQDHDQSNALQQVQALQHELDETQTQLSTQREQQQEQVRQLQQQVQVLEQQLSEAQALLSTQQQEYNVVIQGLNERLKSEQVSHENAVESWENQVEKLTQELQAALELSHQDTWQEQTDIAVAQAVAQVEARHEKHIDKLRRRYTAIHQELEAVQHQLQVLKRRHDRKVDDLLEARQALLKANEIVRLYNMQWHGRWIVVPFTQFIVQLNDKLLQPLGSELYILGQPLLDPLYIKFGKPLMPVMVYVWQDVLRQKLLDPTWEFLCQVSDRVGNAVHSVWKVPIRHVLTRQVELGIVWAWPHMAKAVQITFDQVKNAYSVWNEFCDTVLIPALKPVWDILYEQWMNYVITPWDENYKPIVTSKVAMVQQLALQWWISNTQTWHDWVKEKQKSSTAADDNDGPPSIVFQVTEYWVTEPEESLEFLTWGFCAIASLVVLRLLFWKFCCSCWCFGNGGAKRYQARSSPHRRVVTIQEPPTTVTTTTPPTEATTTAAAATKAANTTTTAPPPKSMTTAPPPKSMTTAPPTTTNTIAPPPPMYTYNPSTGSSSSSSAAATPAPHRSQPQPPPLAARRMAQMTPAQRAQAQLQQRALAAAANKNKN